jgi:hypothetical protein
MYHEWDSDPKVQSMTEAMQRRLAMLFCSRCKEETLQERDRAFHWRISMEELTETKAVFMEKGFIDGNWNPINWNNRQFLSDSSTDRVRRYRQGLKQDETLHVTKGNVTVTGSSASVSVSEYDSGSELMLANWLFEEACIPSDTGTRGVAADAIRLLVKQDGGTTQAAAEYILAAMKQAGGETINRFWFTDRKYLPQKPKGKKQAGASNQREYSEAEGYATWQSMSKQFKLDNPWQGPTE